MVSSIVSSMFRLTCLGATDISRLDGAPVAIAGRQPKRMALLAYLMLASPRGMHRRDSLLAMFWPDLDQDRARAALRQATHALRRDLSAHAIVSEGTECLGVNPLAFTCDLWELEDAVAHGNHSVALSLFSGAPLDGLFVQGAPEFEQWLDGERARVRAMVCRSAWLEAERASAVHGADDVAQQVRRAMALSPFDEVALRRGLSLLDAAGDRGGAISLYRDFEARLEHELETTPSPETMALVQGLRDRTSVMAAPSGAEFRRNETGVVPEMARVEAYLEAPMELSALPARRLLNWRALASVAASAVVVMATVGAVSRLAPPPEGTRDPRRVVVMPFQNASGERVLDTVALRLTGATRDALLQLATATVVAADDASSHSEAAGGTIVRGVVRLVHDSLDIRAEVVDVKTQAIVRSVHGNRVPLTAMGPMVEQLSDRIATAVAVALYPGWGRAVSAPPSLAAYQLFVNAMHDITREAHASAAQSMRSAYGMDSSFTAAGLVAAMEYYQLGRFASADSLRQRIAERQAQLPAVDQQLLFWITRSLAGDRVGARAAMRTVVALEPSAALAWLQLAIDNVETDRPDDALAALDHIDANAGVPEGWASLWATRIEALHLKADHVRELAVAREGLSRFPELRVLAHYEMRALAALGRTDEIRKRLAAGPEAMAIGQDNGSGAVRQTAMELSAHGHAADAGELLHSLLSWYTTRPIAERALPVNRAGEARTRYLLNDVAGAEALYQSISDRNPRCLDCLGVLGVLAARRGDRTAALKAMDALATMSKPYLFGRHHLWRARIAGALGDVPMASQLLTTAFVAGSEFDVMTHADADLRAVRPDQVYRDFSLVMASR